MFRRVGLGRGVALGLMGGLGSGVSGGSSVVVYDSFNRANSATLGTADTGQVWANYGGNYALDTNEALAVTAGADLAGGIDSGLADCEVEAVFVTSVSSTRQGLALRLSDASNYLVFAGGTGGWRFSKYEAGAFSNLASTGSPALVAGDVVKVVLNGTSLSGYVNGNLVLTATSSFNLAATIHGFTANVSNNRRWDEFYVRSL